MRLFYRMATKVHKNIQSHIILLSITIGFYLYIFSLVLYDNVVPDDLKSNLVKAICLCTVMAKLNYVCIKINV